MKKSITILAAMAALLSTSCSDELNGNDSYSNEFTQAVDTDLTCGVNVFMCSQDTIYDAHIPISVNADVKAVAENKLVHLDCIRNTHGDSYLQPSLVSPQDTTVTTCVKLSVPNHEDMNKTVIVSVRPSEPASRAATKDQVQERLTDVLSYGVYGDLLPGEMNVEHPALDPTTLKDHVENHQSFRMESRTFASYGTSVKEVSESWSANMGVKTPCPKFFNVIKGAFNMDKSNAECHQKEYLMLDGQDYRAFGLLDDETATLEAGSDAWIGILSARLNDLLHNPKTNEKAYPLTEEGAMALIAAYGSHIPTQTLLGSGVRYETSKTIDAVDNSFGYGISITGENYGNNGGYNPSQADGITSQNAMAFLAKAALIYSTGGNYVSSSGNIDFNYTKKNYAASTDQKSEIRTIGNGSFDGDRWVAGSDPTDWQVLAYGCNESTMRDARLVPLYELISETARKNDPDVELRYQQLKAAIDAPSANSYPKYLSNFGVLPDYDLSAKYVICDFVVKTEDNNNAEPFIGQVKCKDGTYRDVMYYPLRWSDAAADLDEPKLKYTEFDANTDMFIWCVRKWKFQHFYYAIIQSSLHYGIDAITFVPEASDESVFSSDINRGDDYVANGWTRRSYDGSDCGTGLDCISASKVVPYVHYRNSKSRWPAISAVCLFEDTNRYILASSAGTEYDETNSCYTNNYNEFWKNTTYTEYDTSGDIVPPMISFNWYRFTSQVPGLNQRKYYDSNTACQYGWFRPSFWYWQPHHIYVGYSFRTLPTTIALNGKRVPLTALAPKKSE